MGRFHSCQSISFPGWYTQNGIEKQIPPLLMTQKGIDIVRYTLKEKKQKDFCCFLILHTISTGRIITLPSTRALIFNQNRGLKSKPSRPLSRYSMVFNTRGWSGGRNSISSTSKWAMKWKIKAQLAVINAFFDYEEQKKDTGRRKYSAGKKKTLTLFSRYINWTQPLLFNLKGSEKVCRTLYQAHHRKI